MWTAASNVLYIICHIVAFPYCRSQRITGLYFNNLATIQIPGNTVYHDNISIMPYTIYWELCQRNILQPTFLQVRWAYFHPSYNSRTEIDSKPVAWKLYSIHPTRSQILQRNNPRGPKENRLRWPLVNTHILIILW